VIASAVTLLILGACESESPTRPYWEEHISWVFSVSLPDTAYVGVEFSVVISAYGGFENSRVGDDVVTPISGGFQITPYDWEYYPSGPKNRALQTLQHTVPLTVFQSGSAKVEVQDLHYTHPDGYAVVAISNEVLVVPANRGR